MFQANEAVFVHIIVNGQRVEVPGITAGDEFTADRVNRNTGSLVPTQFVDVVTYHTIPADQSRTGKARTYWKHSRQSAAFMGYRTIAVPELDDLGRRTPRQGRAVPRRGPADQPPARARARGAGGQAEGRLRTAGPAAAK